MGHILGGVSSVRVRALRLRAWPCLILRVDIGLAIDQDSHDLRVAVARCVVDGGIAVLRSPVAISRSIQDRPAKIFHRRGILFCY